MRYYATLIDILYNPARYCDHSWLTEPDILPANINTAPAYIKNHFILCQSDSIILSEADLQENQQIDLFIFNWNKLPRAAYMIGLKLFAAHLMSNPLRLKRLSIKEREFLCLPLPLHVPVTIPLQVNPDDENITMAGANFIYFVARQVLPPILLERLKFIFPLSFNYSEMPRGNINTSLSALKWAFDYA